MTSDKAYAVEGRLNQLGLYTDANNVNRQVNSVDANTYQSGVLSVFTTASNSISSTTPTFPSGLNMGVGAGMNYRISGCLRCQMGATAGAIAVQLNGPGAANTFIQFLSGYATNGAAENIAWFELAAQNSNSGAIMATTEPINRFFNILVDGIIFNVTSTGTLTWGFAEVGGAAVPWTLLPFSHLDIWPI